MCTVIELLPYLKDRSSSIKPEAGAVLLASLEVGAEP